MSAAKPSTTLAEGASPPAAPVDLSRLTTLTNELVTIITGAQKNMQIVMDSVDNINPAGIDRSDSHTIWKVLRSQWKNIPDLFQTAHNSTSFFNDVIGVLNRGDCDVELLTEAMRPLQKEARVTETEFYALAFSCRIIREEFKPSSSSTDHESSPMTDPPTQNGSNTVWNLLQQLETNLKNTRDVWREVELYCETSLDGANDLNTIRSEVQAQWNDQAVNALEGLLENARASLYDFCTQPVPLTIPHHDAPPPSSSRSAMHAVSCIGWLLDLLRPWLRQDRGAITSR